MTLIGIVHDVAAALVALALVLAFAARVDGNEVRLGGHRLGWECAYFARTGQPCGSCGLTRGWALAAHARFSAARAANSSAVPTFLAAGAFVLVSAALHAWRTNNRRRDLVRIAAFALLMLSFGGVLVRNLAR